MARMAPRKERLAMMNSWMTGMGWTWGIPLLVLLLLMVAVAVDLGFSALGLLRQRPPGDSAEQSLKRRYARGEIDAEEYEERLRRLRR